MRRDILVNPKVEMSLIELAERSSVKTAAVYRFVLFLTKISLQDP